MNTAQLATFRGRVQAQMESFFPTTISIDGAEPVAAARATVVKSATHELSGLLPGYDVAFRVRRELIAGVVILPEKTVITEAGKRYRAEKIRDGLGDPALTIECKAV